MNRPLAFQRRGIVEGFFGPPWSMKHRAAMFEFGAARGMNTYLYAPKDDPYHREKWQRPYPPQKWKEMLRLIRSAQNHRIDFVYGFHPGKGLHFTDAPPLRRLLAKAGRFYDAGVRTFAILFDDIPSRLEHVGDRKQLGNSLARAEGMWLGRILERQPASWRDVEWWICPSYYTEDPLLARVFGRFEPNFLEKLAQELPPAVACLWTGPQVVGRNIRAADMRRIARRINRRLILWDNYPVNDLSMSREMHLAPLTGRDARLPELVYGYLNNPLLQESLSFIPLATCFDYARAPMAYDPARSWRRAIVERFGASALPHWRSIRQFSESTQVDAKRLRAASEYVAKHRRRKWARELRPWMKLLQESLTDDPL
jgi:hyaluronoglucosaminidase